MRERNRWKIKSLWKRGKSWHASSLFVIPYYFLLPLCSLFCCFFCIFFLFVIFYAEIGKCTYKYIRLNISGSLFLLCVSVCLFVCLSLSSLCLCISVSLSLSLPLSLSLCFYSLFFLRLSALLLSLTPFTSNRNLLYLLIPLTQTTKLPQCLPHIRLASSPS